ncbi:MAG TPA: phospholipase D family protein [Gemmata sp.]|nr:phospholipase D family protein [Gemmata sp.]
MPQLDVFDAKVMGGLLLAIAAIHAVVVLRRWASHEAAIITHFSPKGGCAAAIVAELAIARSEILVQAYSFTCPDIANALIAAAARRVKVVILLDRSNEAETYSELGDLLRHGLEVWIDACHAIAHNKVMVIDGRTIITGSFNFTRQADHENAENLLILRDHRDLALIYRANFHVHREHCHAPGKAPNTSTRTDGGHHPASTPTGQAHIHSRHAA